jgi:hypothetical protein
MLMSHTLEQVSYLCRGDAQLRGAVGERPHQEGAVLSQ